MNYIHHALIGVGTGALGALAVEAVGAPQYNALSLGLGALAIAAGSFATDLDHPKSFISNSIPSSVARLSLAVLAIPILAGLASYLSTHDPGSAWTSFTTLVWGIGMLRWTAIALFASLLLMLLSLLLYKSLHHRGPLHSLLFTLCITLAVCAAFSLLGASWYWGLYFGWGWLWHILADGLTDQGVPLFWPFDDHRRHTLPAWIRPLGRLTLTLASLGGLSRCLS